MRNVPEVKDSTYLPRGVYKAPYTGPRGEWVFMAIKSDHTLLTDEPYICPVGYCLSNVYELLWKMLDTEDPLTTEQVAALERRGEMRLIS